MYTQLDTKLTVSKALSSLMKRKTIEKISVVELCRESGISRTTFYQYFQDIYAVCEWLWDYACKEFLENIGTQYGWCEAHRRMYEFMAENKECFLFTENKKSQNSFLHDANTRSLTIHIRNIELARGNALSELEKTKLEYLSFAIASITHKWIEDGMTVSPAVLEEMIDQLVPDFIVDSVGK